MRHHRFIDGFCSALGVRHEDPTTHADLDQQRLAPRTLRREIDERIRHGNDGSLDVRLLRVAPRVLR